MRLIHKRNCDEKKECHYNGLENRYENVKILRLTVNNIFMQIFKWVTESRKLIQKVIGITL